jgi:hypothetical protein
MTYIIIKVKYGIEPNKKDGKLKKASKHKEEADIGF